LAYIFDPIRNTFVDDEDKSLGNKFALIDMDNVNTPDLDQTPDSILRPGETLEDFDVTFRRPNAEGGRINQQSGTNIMTLNSLFPEKDPTDFDSFKPLDVPGMAFPVGATIGGMRLKDTFFSKDDDKKDLGQSDDKNNLIRGKGPDEPDPIDQATESLLIEEAVNKLSQKEEELIRKAHGRLTFKETDKSKRDDRTALARDLNLPVTKSGMLEIRKGDYLKNRLQLLKDKGVNFDGYYSVGEIANLLGTKSSTGIGSYIKDKKIPFVKRTLFKMVKLNDFLNVYQGTKERIDVAPDVDVRTKARVDFLSEAGKGSFYTKFKDLKKPKFLPKNVKKIYEKYNLTEIEGGHPFPIEFFTKKYGKDNTLQEDRQFDWIYRNRDKLFDKNDLVFQSRDLNTLFRNSINELKKQYKILSPLVDKYEGKGAVKNKKDIAIIEKANDNIMNIVAKSEFDSKKFIEENPNSLNLSRMKRGGLHGALFNTDTGEVSLYAPGKEAGFVKGAAGEDKLDSKLKLAGDYLDIINQVITDEGDKKIFTNFLNEKLLPRFKKGGGVEITPLPRLNFSEGGTDNFAAELEYYLTNPDAELPKMQTFEETLNPIVMINDLIDPRNYPFYADQLVQGGVRVAEFATRLLPATGKLISDLTRKPAFKITGASGQGYVQDYDELPQGANIKGTGIFSEFLENITPTAIEKKIGLDKLIEAEEQKMKDRGSTIAPKILGETLSLGVEFGSPIFPGIKLLKAYANANKLPVDNVTKELLEKEVDKVLTERGTSRRKFLQTAGAGASLMLAKMLGIGDDFAKTTKVAEKAVAETATGGGAPPYFFQLVEKIKKSGKKFESEFDPRVENNISYEGYNLRENLTTGEITITKSTEGGMNVGDDVIEGTLYDEAITYNPGEVVMGSDGKPIKTAVEYDETTVSPDYEGKMKDAEPGLNSIEEIIQIIGPNKIKMSELEAAGYNVNAFPDNIKNLLIDDLQKTN